MTFLNSKGISKLQDMKFWINNRLGEALGTLRADHNVTEEQLSKFRAVLDAMDDLISTLGGDPVVKRGLERLPRENRRG